tara:strand:- start:380 stop:604 length:225 start_codon:yes stop_codon:yes gene_type:complete
MSNSETYTKELCKMIFIYNTLLNGWSVKMLGKDKFEFINRKQEVRKEYFNDTFIKDFLEKNISDKNKYILNRNK